MKKSTLTRFDNENIVFVEIENQEGTAKIIDEVNNTVIDIGGGGADFVNPKFSFDITDEISPLHLITIADFILIQNNQLVPCLYGATGVAATTDVYEGYTLYQEDQETYYAALHYEGEGLTISHTIETENCTYMDEDGSLIFLVTDPAQNASATVTFTAE